MAQAIIVFMTGEHDDAISRVDDLIDTVPFNSICYVVQARAECATQIILPLTFLAGVHASSPWKLAHGESRLCGCDTIVRACTSPNATPLESRTLGGLTGELPIGYIATYRNRSQSLTDIWMEV